MIVVDLCYSLNKWSEKKTRILALIFSFVMLATSLGSLIAPYSAKVYADGETYTFQKSSNSEITVWGTGGSLGVGVEFLPANNAKSNKDVTSNWSWGATDPIIACNPSQAPNWVINNVRKASSGGYTADLFKCVNSTTPTAQIAVSDPSNLGPDGGNGATSGSSSGSADDTATRPSCESSGSSVSWITCAIVNDLTDLTTGIIDKIVNPLLKTSTLSVSDNQTHLYEIWSNFRVYGNIFLIIALLVIVFSEAIGGGLIEAYTARKVLPRLLIAAILINLSFYIVAVLVDITNIFGQGVEALISQPFKAAGAWKLSINGGTGGAALLGVVATAIIAFGKGAGWIGVVVILPAFLTFMGIVFTLLIRRGLIMFLILISPIAFALYVLPNTEQYFRRWWNLLFEALLVYPIIAILFAMANVLGITINLMGKTGALSSTIAGLLSLIAMLMPLFLIPWAFRFAGKALGSIYEGISNYRQRAHGAIKGDEKNPDSLINRVKRRSNVRMAEKGLTGAMVGTKLNPATAFTPGGWRKRRAALSGLRTTRLQELGAETAKASQLFAQNADDDKIMGDLALYSSGRESRADIMRQFNSGALGTGEEAKNSRDQLLAASAVADRIGRNAATRRAALMQGSTIGYAIDSGKTGWDQAVAAMHDISGGDDNAFRSMVNQFQYVAKNVGRADLSGNTDSGEYNPERAFGSWSTYELGNGKTSAVKGFGEYWTRQYKQALANNDVQGMTKARTAMHIFKAAKQNAKTANANEINKILGEYDLADKDYRDIIAHAAPADAARRRYDFEMADQNAAKQASRPGLDDFDVDPSRRGSGPTPTPNEPES